VTEADPDFARRAEERRKRATERVFRSHAEADAAEDDWLDATTPAQRLAAVWELALEYEAWSGIRADQRGLQGSVARVRRP
jgi:hypothetical protein